MATTGHTVKAFDEELDQLRATICEMGGLAEAAIRESMEALVRRDADAARAVVARDVRIDELEAEVERRAVQIIALRAPMADDLRDVVAALKIAGVVERIGDHATNVAEMVYFAATGQHLADDLRDVVAALKIAGVVERIGDYAKNIAKRVASVEDSKIRPISLLPEMARIAGEMVQNVLDAFAARDAEKAAQVCDRDAAVDDFYNSIFRALLTHMMENPHNITPATHLLFVAKNLERIGDHATNVAEMVYFAATGQHLADRAKGPDVTKIGASDLEV